MKLAIVICLAFAVAILVPNILRYLLLVFLRIMRCIGCLSGIFDVSKILEKLQSEQDDKPSDVVRAICAIAFLGLALYGLYQYEGIKRPYVALTKVEVKSNLADPNNLIQFHASSETECSPALSAKQKQKTRKKVFVTAREILDERTPACVRDTVEELLIDLHFTNSGLVGATDCEIRYLFLANNVEVGMPLDILWKENWEKEQHKDNRTISKTIVLNPQQENVFGTMTNRKGTWGKVGDPGVLKLLCDVQYNSVTNRENLGARPYRVLSLSEIRYYPGYTDKFYSHVVRSEFKGRNIQ